MNIIVTKFYILILLIYVTHFINIYASDMPQRILLNAKVDSLFTEWNKWDSPGAALVIVKNNKVIYKRGYGGANLEYNIAITPSTIFHVASISKQFTAFSIAMLNKKGRLSLDDDIHKYLPEVPQFGKTITIRHLIHHTSGLRDQWELLSMAGWRLDDVITQEHIMKMVKHQNELNFDPGEEYLYSNTGYTLLAEIVERVTGESFRTWTEANIFKPLGMSDTHFHDDHEMIVKNRAYSYAPDDGIGLRKQVLNYANVGATSLFTTVEDLAKWLQNFDDPVVGDLDLIKQIHTRGILNNGDEIKYAFGLSTGTYKGLKIVDHSGSDAGYRSYIVRFPDQKFAVAILSNLSSFCPWKLALKVADIYLADQITHESSKNQQIERTEKKLELGIINAYLGRYLFDPNIIITLTKEENQLIYQKSDFQKVKLLPQSETKFFFTDTEGEGEIIFKKDDSRIVTGLLFLHNNHTMEAKKINNNIPISSQLKEFEGDYYSEELGTNYKIISLDTQLVVLHRRHENISLIATFTDQFVSKKWWFSKIKFMRGHNNRVTGFLLSGYRVRNLRFEKM